MSLGLSLPLPFPLILLFFRSPFSPPNLDSRTRPRQDKNGGEAPASGGAKSGSAASGASPTSSSKTAPPTTAPPPSVVASTAQDAGGSAGSSATKASASAAAAHDEDAVDTALMDALTNARGEHVFQVPTLGAFVYLLVQYKKMGSGLFFWPADPQLAIFLSWF